MAGQTICKSCGEPIPQERCSEAPERRTPCSNCGSTGRSYFLVAETGRYVVSGSDVGLTVVHYPEVLLQTAQRLFDSREYGVAVVVAHTACEVAVERIISQAFAQSNIPQVADSVVGLLSGFNISNPRIRSLFDALTGKDVAADQEDIWEKFGRSVKRRNLAVHKGNQPSEVDTQESLKVAGELVQYLMALIR